MRGGLAEDFFRKEYFTGFELRRGRLRSVVHVHQRGRMDRGFECFRDRDGDRLTIELHGVVLQEKEQRIVLAGLACIDARRIPVRHDRDDARHRFCARVVDRNDAPLADLAGHDDGVRQIGGGRIGRVTGGARDFGATVDAIVGLADQRLRHDACATISSARTSVRFASAILKSF